MGLHKVQSISWSDKFVFKILSGSHGCWWCFQLKTKRTIQDVLEPATSVTAPLRRKRYGQVLERFMLPTRRRLFQGHSRWFPQDDFVPYNNLRVIEYGYATDLPALHTCPPVNMCGTLRRTTQIYNYGDHRVKFYIKQNWDKILLSKLQQ